jgi:hypothetical protein
MNCPGSIPVPRTRREFLRTTSSGFGLVALAGLMADKAYAGLRGAAAGPHWPARARHVIFCFMDGGPSHVDTFDYKPALAERQGEAIGDGAVSKLSQSSAARVWLGSPWEFNERGASGLWVSDLLPHIAECADDLCVVRSLVGQQPLHGQQCLLLHTGRVTGLAPSLGSWITYGLGTENEELPGYVLLNNDWVPNGGFENFSSAFLPATHGATLLRAKGATVDNIAPADSVAVQRRKLELLEAQDGEFGRETPQRDLIESAIRNYETAFRMQSAIPRVADVSGETQSTRRLYGLESANDYQKYYGLQCLRARRLIEAGVRFITLTSGGWDTHANNFDGLKKLLPPVDQGLPALVKDLEDRGMLDNTLVVWLTDFGRTPKINSAAGRDHWSTAAFAMMAGAGTPAGTVIGATDDEGGKPTQSEYYPDDIAATIYTKLGIPLDTWHTSIDGRPMKLCDGRPIPEWMS